MDRSLDSLSSQFKPIVFELLARLVERGVYVLIVQTGRTLAEHRQNLANGTSRTSLSKHLPRELRGFAPELRSGLPDPDASKSDAIDLCPYDLFQIAGPDKLAWNEHETPATTAAWATIGEEAERLGLRWGGRWHDPHDPGHVEYVFPAISTV